MSEEKRNVTILINGKEVTNTIAAINREYRKSIKELSGMTRGSEEYNAKMAEIKQLKGILTQHRQDIAGVEKQLEQTTKTSSKFTQIMGGGLKSLNGSFLASVASATAVFGAISSGIRTIREFNVQMDKVQAISGANAEQMAILEATAKEMGATTVFSASESAEAMTFMAMAGWDTQQIVAGLPGVLDLAAASGESLATTSDIVTDALTAFGQGADQSGKFADLLAKTSSSANTNVAMMGDTFRYVAPIFGAFGFSAEDAALATGLMANAGIKATQAGTVLRGALARMAKPTNDVAATMEQLGLNLTDADGNFLPFIDTMDQLRAKFSQLTPEQQASSAATLFGTEAMSGMLAIVNASEADYNKLTYATRNYDGAAREMADTMNDNLDGSMKRLGSVIESIVLEFSDADGFLKRFVDSISDALAGMSSGMRIFLVVAGGMTAVLGPVLMMLPSLAQGFALATKAVAALNGAILANPFVAAGVALTGLGLAASQYISFTDAATSAANSFNKAVNEAEVQAAKQTAEVERLSRAVLDETKSEEKRLKALEDLKKIAPEHFGNLTMEKAVMGELASAVDSYRDSLLRAAKTRVFTKQLDEAIERQERLKQELSEGPSMWDQFFGSFAGPAGQFALMNQRVGTEISETAQLITRLEGELEGLSMAEEFDRPRSVLEKLNGQLEGSMALLSKMERGSDQYNAQIAYIKELRDQINALQPSGTTVTPAAGTGGGGGTDPGAVGAMGNVLAKTMERLELEKTLEINTAQEIEAAKLAIAEEGMLAWQQKQEQANQKELEDAQLLAEQKAEFQQEMTQLAVNTASQLLGNQIATQARRQQQALDEQREQGLISEEEYQAQREEVQRRAFNRQKTVDTATAIINGALAVTKATAQTGVLSPFVIPGILASTAAQVALIQSQKYEEGGEFLVGPSHKRGGMPVIDPRTGRKRAELEGGEFIIRKRAVTPSTLPLLRAINEGNTPQVNFGRYRKWKYEEGGIFGMDGTPMPDSTSKSDSNEALIQEIRALRDDVNRYNRELRVTLSTTELRDFEQRRNEVEKIASVRA